MVPQRRQKLGRLERIASEHAGVRIERRAAVSGGRMRPGDAEWLTCKLAQFPSGVMFRVTPSIAVDARQRAEEAVRAAGRVGGP
jgi:hypothetical protein